MRIVGGKYRGKKLIAPDDFSVRPTSDRAREAIFNILYSLQGGVGNKKVLDVFCGTGALGLEALSRGAENVCFIDRDVKILRKNIALFPQEKEKIGILCSDIKKINKARQEYDLIFSDAPYDKGLNETAFDQLLQNGFIQDKALCIIETRHNESLELPNCFELYDQRVYGMAKVWFYIFHQ